MPVFTESIVLKVGNFCRKKEFTSDFGGKLPVNFVDLVVKKQDIEKVENLKN